MNKNFLKHPERIRASGLKRGVETLGVNLPALALARHVIPLEAPHTQADRKLLHHFQSTLSMMYQNLHFSLCLLFKANRVQAGLFGNGRPVGHQTEEKAPCHVAQTPQLAGFGDLRRTCGAKDLYLPFWHLLKFL
jgi:hypothetical protein